jgi:hypothetical protein
MIFYQQSATVEKKLRASDLVHARWETGVGTILTQCLTGAALVAAADGRRDQRRADLGALAVIALPNPIDCLYGRVPSRRFRRRAGADVTALISLSRIVLSRSSTPQGRAG